MIIYVYLDFHVNLISMTIGETLDYISFFSFKCNGTSLIAEIHRAVMNDLPKYRQVYVESESMYEFLVNVSKELFPNVKGIGSCSDPRSTYSAGSNNTVWSSLQGDLLELCHTKFYKDSDTLKTKASMNEKTSELIHELLTTKDPQNKKKKKYCGVGTMGAVQFVHRSAIFGILPLYCYTFAELIDDDLGPPRFIRMALKKDKKSMPIKECNDFFISLHKDFSKIWGPLVSRSILENGTCELIRCYKATVAKMKIPKGDPLPDVDVITDETLMVDGRIKDLCFYDEKKGRIQNFFNIGLTDSLRPDLIMKKSDMWGESNMKANISLTNWCMNKDDTKNLQWKSKPQERTLNTGLSMSSKLEKCFLIDE